MDETCKNLAPKRQDRSKVNNTCSLNPHWTKNNVLPYLVFLYQMEHLRSSRKFSFHRIWMSFAFSLQLNDWMVCLPSYPSCSKNKESFLMDKLSVMIANRSWKVIAIGFFIYTLSGNCNRKVTAISWSRNILK